MITFSCKNLKERALDRPRCGWIHVITETEPSRSKIQTIGLHYSCLVGLVRPTAMPQCPSKDRIIQVNDFQRYKTRISQSPLSNQIDRMITQLTNVLCLQTTSWDTVHSLQFLKHKQLVKVSDEINQFLLVPQLSSNFPFATDSGNIQCL